MNFLAIFLGKITVLISRLYGGGSALPGLVMEKITLQPMIADLKKLPKGVVVVSGTNGKTSSTKFLTKILQDQGLKVFTNDTGGNFVRGIASAWLKQSHWNQLQADIAILELDEAHAKHFINIIPPNYCLLLNVFADQLDRYGSTAKIAQMLAQIAQNTTAKAIVNGSDRLLKKYCQGDNLDFFYFKKTPNATCLIKSEENSATYLIDNQSKTFNISLKGEYNHQNLTGVIAVTQNVLGKKLNHKKLANSLKNLKPAIGRGEIIIQNGRKIHLYMVKNTAGFNASLKAFYQPKLPILISVNNYIADGENVDWLRDVNFNQITKNQNIFLSGLCFKELKDIIRSHRLATQDYILITKKFCAQDGDLQIFANYTAIYEIRKILKKL